ncbi:hypothetical protein C8J57DRAFT_1340367 [Mycena rebaudengoi]|nr:hypothetical protein C8J57DRAFT_1340367 [Mycena rebaudengoi]
MQHDFWGSFATYACTAYRVCTYLLLFPPAILAQIPTAESTLCKHISLLDMKIKIENVQCCILQALSEHAANRINGRRVCWILEVDGDSRRTEKIVSVEQKKYAINSVPVTPGYRSSNIQ